MSKYIVTACSTIDLNLEQLKKYDIKYLNFTYFLDGVEYEDDISKEGHAKAFYESLEKGMEPKTSQINADRFISFFTPFLEKGLDILHISFSSALSGTYNSARIAVEMLKEDYPDRKILLIDSLAASSGYGLLVTEALNKQKEGMNVEDLRNYIEDIKLTLNHWFYSTDLTYYIKGGRVTRTAGFIGSTLNICPILNVNDEGKLIPRMKVVGKKRVLNRILNVMEQEIANGLEYNQAVYISHSNILEDAIIAKERILEKYPNVTDVIINDIGPTIGSHTGPGTLAIFFFGNIRTE